MLRTTCAVGVAGLLALATGATAQDTGAAAPTEPEGPTIGEPAPDFNLRDAEGNRYGLSDYEGKIVVLQWINPECPVCHRVTADGLVAQMLEDLVALDEDIVHLAINSTSHMEPETSAAYFEEFELESPVLIDRSGRVGRRYNARTTPHMFVIDGEGVLRYDGAIDDDQRGNNDDRTNYVVNAVTQIVAGETVAPDTTRPYGCSVKYAEGTGRERRNPELLAEFDANGDGELDDDERRAMRDARRQAMLERFDTDGDGELSEAEREAMREALRGERRGGRGGRGGGGGGGGDG